MSDRSWQLHLPSISGSPQRVESRRWVMSFEQAFQISPPRYPHELGRDC
jgi:hypothetical protein